jgi:hypothetical protein
LALVVGLSALLVTAGYASNSGASKAPDTARPQLSQWSDDQKLRLYEFVPLGASISQVRVAVPNLGPQRPEGIRGSGLTDAETALNVLGLQTRAEFNFRNDRLYAVSFGPVDLPADSGNALFHRLTRFYTRRLGRPRVEDGEDAHSYEKSRSWSSRWGEVGTIVSLSNGRGVVGWGYQQK